MRPRGLRRWLPLLALLLLPHACAPDRHEFLPDLGAAGDAGTTDGGAARAGRGGSGAAGAAGRGGATSAGDAGQKSGAGDAGSGGEGGAEPAAGSGPLAGGAGQSAGGGAGGTGGTPPIAGSGGASAGSGGGPAVAPTIVDTTPANASRGVRSDQSIVVVFSQPMNHALTEAGFDKQSLPAGTFSWSADSKTMTYKPSSALLYALGTAPASTQARLYSYALSTNAQSAAGVPLAAAQTVGFTTARSIAVELFPTESWSVKTPGVATPCSGACTSLPIGDDASNLGLRGVFRYNAALPPEAFVEDVYMYIDIAFSTGNVVPLQSLQTAKTATVSGSPMPTGSSFAFSKLANGLSTTSVGSAPLTSNGSFGTTDLYVAVQWSLSTNNDSVSDTINVSDGHLLTRYLIP